MPFDTLSQLFLAGREVLVCYDSHVSKCYVDLRLQYARHLFCQDSRIVSDGVQNENETVSICFPMNSSAHVTREFEVRAGV